MAQKYKIDYLNTFRYFILNIFLSIIPLCFKKSQYIYEKLDISVALDAKFRRRASQAVSNVDVIAQGAERTDKNMQSLASQSAVKPEQNEPLKYHKLQIMGFISHRQRSISKHVHIFY